MRNLFFATMALCLICSGGCSCLLEFRPIQPSIEMGREIGPLDLPPAFQPKPKIGPVTISCIA